MKTIQELSKEIENLTHWNNHSEAVLVLCEFVGGDELIKQAEYTKNKHSELGFISGSLKEHRDNLRQIAMNELRSTHGEQAAQLIHSKF